MVNFIGQPPATEDLAKIPGVHIHHYGKTPKPQRKVGHATVTAADDALLDQRLLSLTKLIEDQ